MKQTKVLSRLLICSLQTLTKLKRKKIVSLGAAFESWVEGNPFIKEGLDARRSEQLFRKKMGFLDKYIAHLECRGRILYVTLYSSAMRAKMMVVKQSLLSYINEELGRNFLQDIRFS